MMKPSFYKVKDEKGLIRDAKTGAILASDLSQKKDFLLQQKRMSSIDQIDQINNRIDTVEKDVKNILDLLKQLINKNEPNL